MENGDIRENLAPLPSTRSPFHEVSPSPAPTVHPPSLVKLEQPVLQSLATDSHQRNFQHSVPLRTSVTDCLCFKPSPVVLAGFLLHQNRTDPNNCFSLFVSLTLLFLVAYNRNCCSVSQAQASRMSRFCAAAGSAITMCGASVCRRRGWAEKLQVPQITDVLLFCDRPILHSHARLIRRNQVFDESRLPLAIAQPRTRNRFRHLLPAY